MTVCLFRTVLYSGLRSIRLDLVGTNLFLWTSLYGSEHSTFTAPMYVSQVFFNETISIQVLPVPAGPMISMMEVMKYHIVLVKMPCTDCIESMGIYATPILTRAML